MFAAYILQTGIVAIAWGWFTFINSFAKYLITALTVFFGVCDDIERCWNKWDYPNPETKHWRQVWRQPWRQIWRRAWEDGKSFQEEAFTGERCRDVLVASLTGFQKAQVFFMLAVQVAAVIALKNLETLQASSLQQLINDLGVLLNVAFGGCIPVILVILML